MLSVWEAIKTRRSIRKFAPDDVPEEMIEQILEAARLAPSGANSQPWGFVVVRDKEVREELCRIRSGQKFIAEAPVVIVCFADLSRYWTDSRKKRMREFVEFGVMATLSGRFAEPGFRKYMESMPAQTREQLITPAIANTYIAIEHMALMATALGLGTCWVGSPSNSSDLNELLGLPEHLVPVALLPVGYPGGEIPPQRPRVSIEEIVHQPRVQLAKESTKTR